MTSAVQGEIQQAALSAGVDPGIALAVAQTESGFNQSAVSSAGAIGIFQLLASTALGLGVDPNDATQNIQGGIAYLAQMYSQFGNWPDALAAYNWGPGNVASVVAQYGSGSMQYYPASVQNYVNTVLARAQTFGTSAATLTATAGPLGGVLSSLGLGSLMPTTTMGYALWGVGIAVVLALALD